MGHVWKGEQPLRKVASVESPGQLRNLECSQLAEMAQGADGAAFSELARRHRPRLLVVLKAKLGGRADDAEDVAQEALAKAWSCIDNFDTGKSFSAWLYTIALRKATDHWRSQSRRDRHTLRARVRSVTSTTVENSLADRESVENIWSIARRVLSPTQYIAMWLRYGEDMSIEEIATATGRTRVGIRVLLHRARGVMQASLADHKPATEESP